MDTKKKSTAKKKSAKAETLKSLQDLPPAEPKTEVMPPEEKPSKLRQVEIPGTERPVIKDLDDAGELYVDLRDKMQSAVKAFKERGKTPLINLMHKYKDKLNTNGEGETVYQYSDMTIILKPAGEVLRVKHVDPEGDVEVGEAGEAPVDHSEGD